MPYDPSMQRRYRQQQPQNANRNPYRDLSPALSSLPDQRDHDARIERETRAMLSVADRRQKVDQLNLAGVSNREIGRQLRVHESTIRDDMRIITQERLWERGVTTLGERLDLSVRRRLQSYTALMLIGASALDEKAKVQAHAEANKILNDIDRLEGTAAPDSMNSAVLAEVMDVVMETLAEADPAVQRRVLEALAQRQPGGTQLGAMMGQALPMPEAPAVEADEVEAAREDGEQGEQDGADTENAPSTPQRDAYYADPPLNRPVYDLGYETEDGLAPPADEEDDPFADWPQLPAE